MTLNQMSGRAAMNGSARAERVVSRAAASAVEWVVAAIVGTLVTLSLTAPQSAPAWQGSIWREGSLLMALALVVVLRFNITRAGPFMGIFASWLIVIAIGTIARFGQVDPMNELMRHVYMIGIGALAYQACGTKTGRSIVRKFIWFILMATAVICISSMADLVAGGWSWEKARVYKSVSLLEHGIAYNSLLFIMVVALVTLARSSKAAVWVWRAAFAVMLVGSVLLGTRAPVVSMIIAWAAVIAYSVQIRLSGRSVTRFGATILAALGLAIPLIALGLILSDPTSPLARLGAGRMSLWQISIAIWQENPILGVGPNALKFGAQDFLNFGTFTVEYQRQSILSLGGGGFHNLWLDTLASKGVVGLVGLLVSYFLLLRTGLLRAAEPKAQSFLVLLLILLARSFVEVSGLYGYQNAPLDFVVMVALAASMREAISPWTGSERSGAPKTSDDLRALAA